MSEITPVSKAIEALGGISKAAAALGITNPSVVANWRMRNSIPARYVLKIEALTGISRHVLKPEIFGKAA
jgi:Uncharacterized protein conserved in bacteria, prophage-related